MVLLKDREVEYTDNSLRYTDNQKYDYAFLGGRPNEEESRICMSKRG